ncbi:hypothetical protein, partial [Pseudomonas helleri]|uniref:hypothetical protein n=1 Tax=Pseudomonas helleri TaxID=1608996 RepID=UPI003F99B981
RVTHCAKPAFGQRGLMGPLRSRSKARSRSKDREQARSYKALKSITYFMFDKSELSSRSFDLWCAR